MRSLVVAAVIGAVVGAAAVDAALHDGGSELDVAPAETASGELPQARQRRAQANEPGALAMRARVYARVVDSSPQELLRSFEAAAESAPSPGRDLALATTLTALAERAVNTALDALRRHRFGRRMAHALALAFVEGAGITIDNTMAVMAVLPQLNRVRFAGEAAAALAVDSSEDALLFARAFDAKLERMSAIAAVAEIVGDRDPYEALRMAESIPLEPGVLFRPDRRVFQMTALRYLAQASFVSAAEYVARELQSVPSLSLRNDLLRVLNFVAERADPQLLLQAAGVLDANAAQSIESTAIERLARENPLDALAYLGEVSSFQQRARLKQEIARSYGQKDPDAALAWVATQGAAAERLTVAVLEGVARKDPLRALDFVLETELSNESVAIRSGMGFIRMTGDRFNVIERAFDPNSQLPAGLSRAELIASVGERLLAIDDTETRQRWIRRYVSQLSRDDPAAALTYAGENLQDVRPWIYRTIAESFRADPLAAMEHIDLVPEHERPGWIEAVATQLAQRDPAAAIEWIGQYRGQPLFSSLAPDVASNIVSKNPVAALDLLATLPPERQMVTSRRIAQRWAETDPIAARAWVESLPPGEYRDTALPGLLSTNWGQLLQGATMQALDPTVLAMFSSEAARQEAVVRIAEDVSHRYPAAAQALLDTHVTDPAMRARFELRLERRELF
jgi:hypothetical protein